MDLNGVMLAKEHAVFVVIPILILFCTGTPDGHMHAQTFLVFWPSTFAFG